MTLWAKAILCGKSSLLEQSLPRTPSRQKQNQCNLRNLLLKNSCQFVSIFFVPLCHRYLCLSGIFTTVERALQINFFMQYKPNLPENQVNASSVLAKGYEAVIVFWPKNPKANFLNGKMNINYAITTNYENISDWTLGKNKPNSKPIQSQFPKSQNERKIICYRGLQKKR